MSYRNKYLFPLIKEGQVYDKNDIVLDENKAKTYLECLAMTMDKSSDVYMAEVPSLDSKKDFISSKLNKDYNIIIKKSTWNSTESDNDSESGSKYKSLKITKQKEEKRSIALPIKKVIIIKTLLDTKYNDTEFLVNY